MRPRGGGERAIGVLLLVVFFLPAANAQNLDDESGQGEKILNETTAERLFLQYINDPANLIRNCSFLGGVGIDSLIQKEDRATVRIRYRIQCVQEEFETPPLSRTLREDFIYRRTERQWMVLGRAVELPPAQRGIGGKDFPSVYQRGKDPLDDERKLLAEQILCWAVLDRRPSGVEDSFPGGGSLGSLDPLMVSRENLGSITALRVDEREVLILSPEALLQKTTLAGEGIWVRFDAIDLGRELAQVRVSLVTPVLPPPPPGDKPTRPLSRLIIDFTRQGDTWVLTRFREP